MSSKENKGIRVVLMLPAGTVVHVGGIPVGLRYDTAVEANSCNVPVIGETLSEQGERHSA